MNVSPLVGRPGAVQQEDGVVAVHYGDPLREQRLLAEAAGVNISTIYRTLELLEQLGLVTHTHLGHGAPTYHSATDEDHLHLVCRVCGQIIETDVSVADHLIEDLATQQGFVTDVTHFAIFGRCKDCVS